MPMGSYAGQAAAEAVARAARDLTGLELCTITVLYPPGFQKLPCSLAGVAEGVVRVETSLFLTRSASVEISIGHAMIIFGAVCGVAAASEEGGVIVMIVITSAVILHAASA